jgi:hypothetical protein
MARALPLLDIQFGDKYEPEKMRRIAEELRRAQRALNALTSEFTQDVDSGLVAEHALVGPEHSVSGLQPGLVIKAISAEEVTFTTLLLDELGDVETEGVLAGQVLTRIAGGYGFSSIPDLSSLADPGGNRLVWWDDSVDHLDYLIIGDGLVVAGGELQVAVSSVDHGTLGGLSNDDHPQYAGIAQDEMIVGAWDFNTPVDFVDTTLAAELQRYRLGIEGDLFLALVDDGDSQTDLLRASRTDGTTVDTLTIGSDSQLRLELRGSLLLPDDDQSIYLGSGGELALYRNEEYAEVTNLTGILHVTSDDGLRIQTDLLEVDAPESVAVDAEAYTHAGRWTRTLSLGRYALGAYDEEYSGEDFLTIDMDGTEVESVNISGDSFTFNGADILALQGTQTTIGAAGGASALPATPVGYATLIINGVSYAVPYYNP